jgi:predicted Zn finger-like uncharacterized protein
MNIACTACSARYGVADEKLLGKRVKITCKRCGAVLIVDGNVSPPTVSVSTSVAPGPASGRPSSSRAPEPAPRPPEPPFMVAFADGRQDEADVAQIVRLHRSGQLGPDTLVWREGMDDWKNPWDVVDIAAAFRKMGYARPTPAPAPAQKRPRDDEETTKVADSGPMQSALFDDDEQTQIVDSQRFNEAPLPSFASRPGAHAASEDDEAATNVARSPLSSPEAAPPPAARRDSNRARQESRTAKRESTSPRRESTRPAGRAEQARRRESRVDVRGPDMFAQQAHAGSEAEQAAQAEQMMAAAAALQDATDDGARLTGARNENSVLFSLDALMQKELRGAPAAAPPRRSTRNDEALLVDTSPSLPGGGGIAAALAAPDYNAPITSPPPRFSPAPVTTDETFEPPKKSKGWMVIVVLVAIGGLGGVGFATGKLQPLLASFGLMAPPAASAEREATPAASGERVAASASPEASAAPDASSAPAASASSDLPAPPTTGIATTTATAPATGAAPVAAAPGGATIPRAPGKEKEKEKEAPPAATGFGAGAAFDAQAAKTALGAAAGNASSCKEAGGPTGTGRVSITFAASGRPTSVAVTGDLAGTTVGSCVARLFRGARVPAFSGEPVTVSKTFSVQ